MSGFVDGLLAVAGVVAVLAAVLGFTAWQARPERGAPTDDDVLTDEPEEG